MHVLLKVLLGSAAAYGAYKVVQHVATPAAPPPFVPANTPAVYVPPQPAYVPPPSPHVDIEPRDPNVPVFGEPTFIGPPPPPSPGMHVSVDPSGFNRGATDDPAQPGEDPGFGTNEEA